MAKRYVGCTPNSSIALALTDTAAKCCGSRLGPSRCRIQARAARALVSVSSVVKVLEQMMNSVRSGSACSSRSASWQPSTLEANATLGAPALYCLSACTAMAGPRSEPPIPMFTTSAKLWSLLERMIPWRTSSAKLSMCSRSARTCAPISSPATSIDAAFERRNAVCSTARFSVLLMASPRNMASMRDRRLSWSASAAKQLTTRASTRWRE